jgi:hypothetical protein
MVTEEHADLDWLAFRYVAGEMPAAECELFEQRLALEQAAREAVAAAVELTAAIAHSADVLAAAAPECAAALETAPAVERVANPSAAPRTSPRPRGRRLAELKIPAVVAAGLLLAASSWLGSKRAGHAPRQPDMARTSPENFDRLASIWANRLPESDDWRGDSLRAAASLAGDSTVSRSDSEEAEPDDVVPDWLLAAVSVRRPDGQDPAEMPQEN